MNYQIRKLKTKDVFSFVRILKKLKAKDEMPKLNISQDKDTNYLEVYGTKLIYFLIDNLDSIENDVYEFVGDIVGMTPEAFSNLDLTEIVNILDAIVKNNNISAFSNAVSKLTISK